MKRMLAVLLAVVMTVAMVGCSPRENVGDEKMVQAPYDPSTPESILEGIEADFTATAVYLEAQWEVAAGCLGTTFKSYCENKQSLTDWYELVGSESDALFARTSERAAEYFEMCAGLAERDERIAAMDAFEIAVNDDYYVQYKDLVYSDLLERPKNEYYNGVLDDPEATPKYMDWVNAHSEAYSQWVEAHSDFYTSWVDAKSGLYSDWVTARGVVREGVADEESGFESDLEQTEETETTTESITEATTETITESTEENTTEEAADNRSDISPEFKEMMDSYEQFFDEYIAFMENYDSEETGVLALVNYADMLAEYAQMIESMEEMDESDMTETELGYYLEVTGRIYQKLAASPALY